MSETSSQRHPLRRRTDPIKVPVSGVLELLRTDMVIHTACVFALLTVFLQSLRLNEEQSFYVEAGADLGMVLLAVLALLVGIDDIAGRRERRFWGLIAAGFGAWGAIFVLFLLVPAGSWASTASISSSTWVCWPPSTAARTSPAAGRRCPWPAATGCRGWWCSGRGCFCTSS